MVTEGFTGEEVKSVQRLETALWPITPGGAISDSVSGLGAAGGERVLGVQLLSQVIMVPIPHVSSDQPKKGYDLLDAPAALCTTWPWSLGALC